MKRRVACFLVLAITAVLMFGPVAEAAKKRMAFGGGPPAAHSSTSPTASPYCCPRTWRTWRFPAKALAVPQRTSNGSTPAISITASSIRSICGSAPRAVARGCQRSYAKVKPMAYLYGAPAQLVVRRTAASREVTQLAGKKVAVGNAGSGQPCPPNGCLRPWGSGTKSIPSFSAIQRRLPP